MPVKCRHCGGPHWTAKCDQHKSSADDVLPTETDLPKSRGVRFKENEETFLPVERGDTLNSLEEFKDSEWGEIVRQPSLELPLIPSTSNRDEILANVYLSRVHIYSPNAAERAVQLGHVRIVGADGMSKQVNADTKIGIGSELLIERSLWLQQHVLKELEGETLCIIVKGVPSQYPGSQIKMTESWQYYDVNRIFDSLQMEAESTDDIFRPRTTSPVFTPKKSIHRVQSRFSVRLEKDFVRGSREGIHMELGGTTDGGVHAVGKKHYRVVAKKQEEDPSTPVSKRHGFGFLIGEEVVRERAAYLLDKCYRGFSNVPPTAIAKIEDGGRSETVSIQKFKESNDSVEDYGPQFFRHVPAIKIQKIGILDIRLFNTDRHGGNILWKDPNQKQQSFTGPGKSCDLIPIDHGGCLPDYCHLNFARFCWMDWEQTNAPWSKKALEHIKKLNPVQDAEILRRKLHIRESCVLTYIICTILLKESVLKHAFTLRGVGDMLLDDETGESELSRIVGLTLTELDLPKPEIASNVSPPPDEKEFLGVFMEFLKEMLISRKTRTKVQTTI